MGILRYDRLIKESKEELEELLKKERDVRVYRRIKVIYLLKKTPKIFSMHMSHLDSVCFNEYLKNLSEKFKNDNIVLIMDNASFHKSKQLKVPKNIKIEYLPPYSPELNPQERRFEDIKKFLKNITFKTIEELEKKVTEILFSYTKEQIKSLVSYNYIIKAMNI